MASFYAGNLVGHTLGNRYRLLDLLGMGSSARVYLAEDVKLRRRVAVKLLHASLAGDAAFLRRFQREAESLAPLTHPNIVIIHDVNDRQNTNGEPPYLVTEYLSGGSLRNFLDAGDPITPAQATLVGLGAARGLTFAHAHGVVHRDIKPANLLFGDDQRVRVADFGLARALADYGRTEPAGALVGTAKYLSPEQSRGTANLDGRSDVYSLALVLYEAVTGEVPFTTDTWQGTAMARLQHDLTVPPGFGPLGPVLEAAGTVDPERRLDAEGFALALEAASRELPRPGPLPLDRSRVLDRAAHPEQQDPTLFAAGSRIGSSQLNDPTSLAPGDSVGGPTRPPTPVRVRTLPDTEPPRNSPPSTSAPSRSAPSKSAPSKSAPSKSAPSKSAPSISAPSRSPKSTGPVAAEHGRGGRSWKRGMVAGVIGLVLIGATVAGFAISQRTPTHTVPNLVGMTLATGQADVVDENFVLRPLEAEFNETVPEGAIIRQDPEAGRTLKEQQEISVVVSSGRKPVDVPELGGRTLEAAIAILEAVGLRSSNPPQFRVDEIIEAGHVVGWTPKGPVAPDSLVTLVVSSGPAEVELPKVRGLRPDAAVKALPPGVGSTVIEIFADSKAGLVTGSEPKAGSMVRRGDTVKLFVSKGPDLVTVPNVINLLPSEAAGKLRKAGFAIGNTIGPADQPVLHTRPLRNTKVRRGTKVTLYTTDEDVPEVPGVAATRSSTTVPSVPRSGTAPSTTAKSQ